MTISKGEDLETIRKKLKELLVSNLAFLSELDPKQIKDDEILFGDGLGLDSLDAVEIVVILQRNFGLDVRDMKRGREIFYSIDTLSHFVFDNTRK
jgi:acyl carrier protein